MDSELDRTLNYWDVQSCAEFEQMLDSREDDEEAYAQWVESKRELQEYAAKILGFKF